MRKIKIKNNFYPIPLLYVALLIMFFFLTSAIFLVSYSHILFLLRFAVLICLGGIGFFMLLKDKNRLGLFLLVTYFVSWFFCFVFQEHLNCSITDMLYTEFYIGCAAILLKKVPNINLMSLMISFFVMGYILLKLLRGVHFTMILNQNSQNYISILILFVLLLYYISCIQEGKNFLVAPCYIFFIISVMVQGRGGILTSAYMTVAMSLIKIRGIENKKIKGLLKIMVALVVFVGAFYLLTLSSKELNTIINTYFSRFTRKGTNDSERKVYWLTFLKNNIETLRNFLFGSDVTRIRDDGNLHNSYLLCYANYGLMMMIIIMTLIIRSLVIGIKQCDYVMLILYTTMLVRAFTDRMFYQGYCEIFLYYFLLYFDMRSKLKCKTTYKGETIYGKNEFVLLLHNTVPDYECGFDGNIKYRRK